MKIEYSKRAISDLHHIADYYADSGEPVVGERIAAAIRERVSRIAEAPCSGGR